MALTPTRSFSIEKVRNLLKGSQTDLRDSQVPTVSVGRRFDAAYDSGFRCALALLEATKQESKGPGHHRESLEYLATTLGLEKTSVGELIPVLVQTRNSQRYDAVTSITENMVKATVEWALRVQSETEAWFQKNLPQALKA